jgi:hypothetical protein
MTAILADPERRAAFEKNVMVPRLGEPADIAASVFMECRRDRA